MVCVQAWAETQEQESSLLLALSVAVLQSSVQQRRPQLRQRLQAWAPIVTFAW
jgi:hypothetical protein